MDASDDRIFGAVVSLGVVVCIALVIAAAHPAVTYNPTQSASLKDELNPIQIVFPEGFAFFTRDPREPDLYLYEQTEDGWKTAALGPNARPANFFGLNRKARAQAVEYALLLQGRGPGAWSSCDAGTLSCLERVETHDTIENVTPRPTLCGTVGFVRQDPIPWAWSEDRDTIEMSSELIKLQVSC